MKTRINLYRPEYQPKLTLISLNSVVFFNLITLVLVLAYYFFLSSQQTDLSAQNQEMDRQLATQQARVDQLQVELDNRKPDPVLMANIEKQKIAISQRQRLLRELSNREQVKQNRFSVVLNELNEADTPNIWLTRIHMKNGDVDLAGYGSTADAMPKWLARLSTTSSFRGVAFEQATMERDDIAISFELRTRLNTSDSPGEESR